MISFGILVKSVDHPIDGLSWVRRDLEQGYIKIHLVLQHGTHLFPVSPTCCVDPLSNNYLGYKRWAFIPKTCPKDMVKVPKSLGGKQTDEAVTWFDKVYPRMQLSDWPEKWKPVELLQGPGDIVFVPGGT